MLFNSYAFILLLLPTTFAGYHLLRRFAHARSAIVFLVVASLFFYGWWSPRYLLVLCALLLVNFALVRLLMQRRARPASARRPILIFGLVFNLLALGYFKYTNFLIDNIDALFGLNLVVAQVVLPLGISFFTFQKIALLVDAYSGKVEQLNFIDYALFVAFFPQLIAGPIVHHSEVMPQFHRTGRIEIETIARGLTIFAIGLAKKVLLADNLVHYASPVFNAAAAGTAPGFGDAWTAAVAYTLQLYFDFSGYTDMAIGAALLFGIRLPLNFASPYKATSIIDFWRRWHMTLSRFLRDYLYIPLGGNRKGEPRRYLNLFVTMLLGGIWHGAGWTLVVWGALHGLYLTFNHLWRALHPGDKKSALPARLAGGAFTFLAVVIAWVFFRADNIPAAMLMLHGMSGLSIGTNPPVDLTEAAKLILPLLGLVWLAPNTQELMGYEPPSMRGAATATSASRLHWTASPGWAVAFACLFALTFLSLSKVSEFIYFQF
jgi:D-alanyl-lipoteichoic acid acyltransferase DltB (MBOAT superfamily)